MNNKWMNDWLTERATPIGNELYRVDFCIGREGQMSAVRAIERTHSNCCLIGVLFTWKVFCFRIDFSIILTFRHIPNTKPTATNFSSKHFFTTLHPHENARRKTNLANCIIKYQVRDQDWINFQLENKKQNKNSQSFFEWKIYANFMHQIAVIIRNSFKRKKLR